MALREPRRQNEAIRPDAGAGNSAMRPQSRLHRWSVPNHLGGNEGRAGDGTKFPYRSGHGLARACRSTRSWEQNDSSGPNYAGNLISNWIPAGSPALKGNSRPVLLVVHIRLRAGSFDHPHGPSLSKVPLLGFRFAPGFDRASSPGNCAEAAGVQEAGTSLRGRSEH